MPSQRRSFTVAQINRLKPAPGKRVEVHDGRIPGFVVRITPAGRKTFCFVYRRSVGGKSRHRRVSLGGWPIDPTARAEALRQAQGKALEHHTAVVKGGDPVQEERDLEARKPKAHTVAWLAAEYIRREAKPSIKTWRAVERTLANHWLPVLGDVPIEEVTHTQLYDVLDGLVAEKKPGAAGEARKAITRLFNWGLERKYLQHTPARLRHKALDAKNRPARARALSDDELAAVWLASAELGTPWRQGVRVLLLTGCRRSEVLEARRSEITRDGWLEIPATRYKTARPHNVPLSAPAREEIALLPGYLCPDPYLFSARAGVEPVRGVVKIKRQLDATAARILGRPLAPYRLHDLRVTCRSRLAELGVPHDVAEAVIGHAKQGVTAIYNKHEYRAERRDALDRYAALVLKLAEAKQRAANG